MDTTTLHGRCFEVSPNDVLIFETFLNCYQPCKKLFWTKSYWFDIDKYNHAGLILGFETSRKCIYTTSFCIDLNQNRFNMFFISINNLSKRVAWNKYVLMQNKGMHMTWPQIEKSISKNCGN